MHDPGHDLSRAPGTPDPTAQPNAAADRRRQIGQLPARELDIYGNQLARCLQALGTNAPIRADIQHELAAVRAEQDSRASAAARSPDVSRLTPDVLHRTQRELQASLALARPCSPVRRTILAHLSAIDTELAARHAGQPGQEPGSPHT